MFTSQLVLKCILFLVSIETSLGTSFGSKEHSKTKPCSAGDFGCIDKRSQRDATLTIIDYDNQHIVCDEDHPYFCDIIDPYYGMEEKSEKSENSRSQFIGRDVHPPKIHHLNGKRYYMSPKNERLESIQNADLPNKSDSFVCEEYGFFPGMHLLQDECLCLGSCVEITIEGQ